MKGAPESGGCTSSPAHRSRRRASTPPTDAAVPIRVRKRAVVPIRHPQDFVEEARFPPRNPAPTAPAPRQEATFAFPPASDTPSPVAPENARPSTFPTATGRPHRLPVNSDAPSCPAPGSRRDRACAANARASAPPRPRTPRHRPSRWNPPPRTARSSSHPLGTAHTECRGAGWAWGRAERRSRTREGRGWWCRASCRRGARGGRPGSPGGEEPPRPRHSPCPIGLTTAEERELRPRVSSTSSAPPQPSAASRWPRTCARRPSAGPMPFSRTRRHRGRAGRRRRGPIGAHGASDGMALPAWGANRCRAYDAGLELVGPRAAVGSSTASDRSLRTCRPRTAGTDARAR